MNLVKVAMQFSDMRLARLSVASQIDWHVVDYLTQLRLASPSFSEHIQFDVTEGINEGYINESVITQLLTERGVRKFTITEYEIGYGMIAYHVEIDIHDLIEQVNQLSKGGIS